MQNIYLIWIFLIPSYSNTRIPVLWSLMNPKGLEHRWFLANILFVKLMLTKCRWEETSMPLDDTSIVGKYLLASSQRPLMVRLHTPVGNSSSALETLGRLSQSGGPIWQKQCLYFQLLSVYEAEVRLGKPIYHRRLDLIRRLVSLCSQRTNLPLR